MTTTNVYSELAKIPAIERKVNEVLSRIAEIAPHLEDGKKARNELAALRAEVESLRTRMRRLEDKLAEKADSKEGSSSKSKTKSSKG